MRIRSPLTDHSLYAEVRPEDRRAAGGKIARGRAPRGRQPVPAGRRIFRLALMLVLVLLLMQQASDPDVYRRFFGAVGTPLDSVPADRAPITGTTDENAIRIRGATAEESPPDSSAAPLRETVEHIDPEQRTQLSAVLAAHRRGADPRERVDGERWDALLGAVAEAAAAAEETDAQALVMALRSPESPGASVLLERLQAGLDESYWRTVSDATIWQPGDAAAFYRLLETDGQAGEAAIRVGFVSLADQPLAYRGRRVAMDGAVARVERQQAADNAFGIEDYWLVWLRPADGSERPVMVFAAEIPETLQQLAGTSHIAEPVPVRADGIFLKRHLYRSQRGSELAPVIVGSIMGAEASAAAPALGGDGAGEIGWRWWITIAIAAVVGIGFTLWATWHTGRIGSWRRRARFRGLPSPEPFLDSLKQKT